MKIGKISQRYDYTTPNYNIGKLQASGWQLIRDFQVPAPASSEKLGILGDAIADVTGKTVTAYGGAGVATDQYKFQELSRSIYFDGTDDYLSIPDSADFDFGTGAFTIDFWIRFPNTVATTMGIFSQYTDDNNGQVLFYDGTNFAYYNNTSGTYLTFYCPYACAANTWYHIAIERISATDATTHRIYINGVSQTITGSNWTRTCGDFTGPFLVGKYTSTGGSYWTKAYISGFRVIKGSAIWTDATVSTPTYPDYNGARSVYVAQNIDGNTDEEYRLVAMFKNDDTGGDCAYRLRLNNDAGANYPWQYINGTNTTASAYRHSGDTGFYIGGGGDADGSARQCLSDTTVKAKSGYVRTAITTEGELIGGTTVTSVSKLGQVWSNTSDNITSLHIVSASNRPLGLGVGTHILLFARRQGSDATFGIKTGDLSVQGNANCGIMQLVERYEVTGSAATSKTFSGLDGNTDVVYELRGRTVNGYNGNGSYSVQVNGDTGNNYGWQRIYASDTTVGADRTVHGAFYCGSLSALSHVGMFDLLLYAKSGYVRTALLDDFYGINGTSISAMDVKGYSWNNTADNITSLVVSATQTGGLGVGTVIELWALRKKTT